MCIYLRLPEAVEDYLEDEYDSVGHRSPRLLINPDPVPVVFSRCLAELSVFLCGSR